jgi:hypothetical protein
MNIFEGWGKKTKAAILGTAIGLGAGQVEAQQPVDLSNKQMENTLTTQNVSPVFLGDTRAPAKMYPEGITKVVMPTLQVKPLDSLAKQIVSGIPVSKEKPFVMPDVIPVDLSKEIVSSNFSLEPGLITEIKSKGAGVELIPVSGLSSSRQHSLNHERHPLYDPLKIQSQKLKTENQDGMVDGTYVLKYLQEKNLFGKCLTEGDLNAIAQNGIDAFHELLKKYNITEIAAWSSISETEGKMTHDDLKSDASDASVLVLTENNGKMIISGRKIKGYFINQFFEAISPTDTESTFTATK